jgi:hypothetical protein
MSDMILRARLRQRDKDLRQSIEQLNMEEGELADMVRDGVRLILTQRGILTPLSPITPTDARLVARELIRSLKEGR